MNATIKAITIYIVSRETDYGYQPIRAFRKKADAKHYINSQYDSGLYELDTVVLS